MKRNDTAGDFCLLYIEASDEKAALFETIQSQKKPVVLMMPDQPRPRIFQRPEDFADLKHLKRQFNIAIIFVTAGNEHLRQLAARYGFPSYLSVDALSRALRLGQVSLSHQRTLAKTGPLTPPVPPTSGGASSPSLRPSLPPTLGGASSPSPYSLQHPALGGASSPSPRPPQPLLPRKTVPLSPLEQSAFKPAPSHKIPSSPLPPVSRKSSPLPPVQARKQRRRFPVVLTILLLVVLAGAGAGSFLVFFHKLPNADPPVPQAVGQISFLSSGQLAEDSGQGIDDEVQIDLHTLAQPAAGKSYYAWLLSDENQGDMQSILLGKLTVNAGSAHMLYNGDAAHTNLLAISSRFLITEEDASPTPISPSPDYSTWRYYGAFPQLPNPRAKDHASFLDHLRYLLASDPLMNDMKLAGGLNNWFYKNTSKLIELTASARDSWQESKDMNAVRDQAITILSYLDGLPFLQQDMPANTPMPTLSRLAAVGLLDMNQPSQGPDSYLSSIVYHLGGLINAPGSSPALRTSAATILTAMSNVRAWLEELHDDARQIAGMTNDQLSKAGALTTLSDMVDQANYAYAGQLNDSSTGSVKEGVIWIHDSLQALATLSVTTYIAGSSSPEMIPSTSPLAANLTMSEVSK